MKQFLSIVVPAFNESVNFEKGSLQKMADYLNHFDIDHEVLIIDDGSTDETTKLVSDFIRNKRTWQLIKNPHQGKAATVAKGVSLAQGDCVLFSDFDQATPISEVEKLLPFLNKGYDIIIGSREVKGAKREKEPFYRHLMGKVFNLLVHIFIFGGIQDTQCGFKLFKTVVAKDLFSLLLVNKPRQIEYAFTGAFDVELLYLAQKRGYKIAEVPVEWRHYKTTRVNPIKDSWKMFIDILKIRFYDFLGKYEF